MSAFRKNSGTGRGIDNNYLIQNAGIMDNSRKQLYFPAKSGEVERWAGEMLGREHGMGTEADRPK